jgi:ataxia telangiectasia mutated family protein
VVPFRLTRNVIDGMGPCGTDGVFSKSAESTLSVLRKNSDTVLTILSAIVSDPLYRWSSSPSTSDDATNEAAQRVMSKVHDKLQGFEVGTSGVHTVAGQVKFLINEARDPNNLCNMYSGWQPWV